MGILIGQLSPVMPEVIAPGISNPLIGMIVFIFLASFLINRTMARNNSLELSISLELSRMRRIAHLVENMSATRSWKKEIIEAILVYLIEVSKEDFLSYKKSHKYFRVVTHEIYEFSPKTDRDKLLFSELLTVTRELAFHRQELINRLASPISPYTWAAFLLVVFINLALLMLVRGPDVISTLYISGASIAIFLVVDILIALNNFTKPEQNFYQKQYEDNAKRIRAEKK